MSHYRLEENLEVPDKTPIKQNFKLISLDCKDVEYGYMFGDNPMETETTPLTAAHSFSCRDICSTTSGKKSYLKFNSNSTFLQTVLFGVGIQWMKAVLYMKLKMFKILLLRVSTLAGPGAEV